MGGSALRFRFQASSLTRLRRNQDGSRPWTSILEKLVGKIGLVRSVGPSTPLYLREVSFFLCDTEGVVREERVFLDPSEMVPVEHMKFLFGDMVLQTSLLNSAETNKVMRVCRTVCGRVYAGFRDTAFDSMAQSFPQEDLLPVYLEDSNPKHSMGPAGDAREILAPSNFFFNGEGQLMSGNETELFRFMEILAQSEVDFDGNTQLHRIMKESHENLLKYVRKQEWSAQLHPEIRNKNHQTCLDVAVQAQFAAGVSFCISVCPWLLEERNEKGDAPLHTAVKIRSLKTVELLVKLKADVNSLNAEKQTPLLLACRLFSHIVPANSPADPKRRQVISAMRDVSAILACLLEGGARVKEWKGMSAPLHFVAEELRVNFGQILDNPEVVMELQTSEWNLKKIDLALFELCSPCPVVVPFLVLLSRGGDLTGLDAHGRTPEDIVGDRRLRYAFERFSTFYRRKRQTLSEVSQCCFCDSAPSTVYGDPCGHLLGCWDCPATFLLSRCPKCGDRINCLFKDRVRINGGVRLDAIEEERKALIAEDARLRDALLCLICKDRSVQAGSVGVCRHLFCAPCANRKPVCPLCNHTVKEICTVYLSS